MTTAQGIRQILYTIVLVVFLRSCTSLLDPVAGAQGRLPEPTLELTVYPRFTLLSVGKAEADVLIQVTVPRNAQNRVLCVSVDGPVYRSSCWEHGPSGQYRQEFPYRSLPAGDYVAVGELQWVDQEKDERKSTLSRFEFRILDGSASGN